MAQMIGANPEELRALASQMRSAADELDGHSSALTSLLGSLPWVGDFASRFLSTWSSSHRLGMSTSAQFIRDAAGELERNAEEQQSASDSFGTGGGPGRPGPFNPFNPGGGGSDGSEGPNWFDVDGGGGDWDRQWRGREYGPGVEPDDGFFDPTLNVWQDEATYDVNLWSDEIGGSTQIGDATAEGRAFAEALGFETGVNGRFGIDNDGVEVAFGGDIDFDLVNVGADGRIDWGALSADGAVNAEITAEASAEGGIEIGADGVEIEGGIEAFAGARARAEGGVEVLGVEGRGGVEAWAGAGIEAEGEADLGWDKVELGGSFGIGLGVGGKVDFEVSFSPSETWNDIKSWRPF